MADKPQIKQATIEDQLKSGLRLSITDPEMISEFKRIPWNQAEEYALRALRIGLLALRSARGEVDAQAVKEQLSAALNELHIKLLDHTKTFQQQLESTKSSYKEIGEQGKSALDAQLTNYKTILLASVDDHVRAAAEPLLKALDPGRADGAVGAIDTKVKQALEAMGTRIKTEVLSQFSRDSGDSAISRIETIVKTANSAITNEFSMDNPASALRRLYDFMSQQMEVLSRGNMDFQTEVREALATITVKKESAAASPEHGRIFEEALGEALVGIIQRYGHHMEATGNTVGTIRSCKVGDFTITLGSDCVGAGEKIVIEAKSAGGYDLKKILEESEVGRKNRGAQVSLFVVDSSYAPISMGSSVERHGDALIVKWRIGDPPAFLAAAISLACFMIVKTAAKHKSSAIDVAQMEREVVEIQRRVEQMADVSQWATTIQSSAAKILDRMRISLDAITTQAELLMDQIKSLGGSKGE